MSFLKRVRLKNYKSIAGCDVELGPLTFLVGPNGSGKSNFLDALRFVADSLRTSLDHGLRERGGINEVRRRSGGHPTHFGIRLDFELPNKTSGIYAFEIAARPRGGFQVRRERCCLQGRQPSEFEVERGEVKLASVKGPAAASDRLYLVSASGLPEFRPLYDALSGMGFYNLNPERIRELQAPDAGVLLTRDGGNITSVLAQLKVRAPKTKERIVEYLEKVAPGIQGVEPRAIGPKETLEFRQEVVGSKYPWRFLAANMSDGTLRALAVLVGLFQSANGARPPVLFVGIEEPEVALHPAALGVLLDALKEASRATQVVVTSHSPDLLDSPETGTDSILAVVAQEGATQIAPIDEAGRKALRDRLYTAGELLRINQLQPDVKLFAEKARQLALFEQSDS